VLVSDIGMDEMDGFELTLEARRQHELEAMPIILVSARDSDADRQRGAASGADGFLSKKDCASGRLLAEVQAVIARRQGAARPARRRTSCTASGGASRRRCG